MGDTQPQKDTCPLNMEKSWDKDAFCLASYPPASHLLTPSFWGGVDPPRSQCPLGQSLLFPDAVHHVKFLLSLLCFFILVNLIKCYQWNKVKGGYDLGIPSISTADMEEWV